MGSNLISERAGRVSKWPKCRSRLIHDDFTDRFDSSATPPEGNGNLNNDNGHASSSPRTQVDIQPNVDVVKIPSDTLNRPELQWAEIVDESDVVQESANCIAFLPKAT